MRPRSYDERIFARALADGDANALLFFESRYRGLIRHALTSAGRHLGAEPLGEGRGPGGEAEGLLRDFVRWLHHEDGRQLRAYRGRCAFGAWLYAVALRYFMGRLAAEMRGRQGAAAPDPEARIVALRAAPADAAPGGASLGEPARLRAAVRALHPLDRLYLRLFFVEGLDPDAVARTLGKRPNAVHARKVRILEKLAALLDEPIEAPRRGHRAVGE